jgi:hypothetical protein
MWRWDSASRAQHGHQGRSVTALERARGRGAWWTGVLSAIACGAGAGCSLARPLPERRAVWALAAELKPLFQAAPVAGLAAAEAAVIELIELPARVLAGAQLVQAYHARVVGIDRPPSHLHAAAHPVARRARRSEGVWLAVSPDAAQVLDAAVEQNEPVRDEPPY